MDPNRLREFDASRLRDLDRRVDDELRNEIGGRKSRVEEQRAKKLKQAQKARRRDERVKRS